MTAPQDLTTDLFCFRHLYKHTVRGSSGPEELIRLTNTWTEKRFSFDLIFKHILTVTASENQVALLSQCLTDPKDTQKICAGVKNWIYISHVPLLPQQQNPTIVLKEACIFCSADQVLFTRTDFTTNLKTATITLLSLLHKGRLQPKIFTNVSETAVIFACQVLGMVTEKVLKQCVTSTLPLLLNLPFQHFAPWEVQLSPSIIIADRPRRERLFPEFRHLQYPKLERESCLGIASKFFAPLEAIPNVLNTAKSALHSKCSLVPAQPKLWEGLHHVALLLGTLTGGARCHAAAWEGRTSRGKLGSQHNHSVALSETRLFFFLLNTPSALFPRTDCTVCILFIK